MAKVKGRLSWNSNIFWKPKTTERIFEKDSSCIWTQKLFCNIWEKWSKLNFTRGKTLFVCNKVKSHYHKAWLFFTFFPSALRPWFLLGAWIILGSLWRGGGTGINGLLLMIRAKRSESAFKGHSDCDMFQKLLCSSKTQQQVGEKQVWKPEIEPPKQLLLLKGDEKILDTLQNEAKFTFSVNRCIQVFQYLETTKYT